MSASTKDIRYELFLQDKRRYRGLFAKILKKKGVMVFVCMYNVEYYVIVRGERESKILLIEFFNSVRV